MLRHRNSGYYACIGSAQDFRQTKNTIKFLEWEKIILSNMKSSYKQIQDVSSWRPSSAEYNWNNVYNWPKKYSICFRQLYTLFQLYSADEGLQAEIPCVCL